MRFSIIRNLTDTRFGLWDSRNAKMVGNGHGADWETRSEAEAITARDRMNARVAGL